MGGLQAGRYDPADPSGVTSPATFTPRPTPHRRLLRQPHSAPNSPRSPPSLPGSSDRAIRSAVIRLPRYPALSLHSSTAPPLVPFPLKSHPSHMFSFHPSSSRSGEGAPFLSVFIPPSLSPVPPSPTPPHFRRFFSLPSPTCPPPALAAEHSTYGGPRCSPVCSS